MAQLKDLVVSGDARIVGKLYADQALPDGVFYLANISGTAAVTTSPYTASKWQTTINDPRITKLYSGLCVSLKIPVAGNGTYGTILDVNGLGYHPVVFNVNSMISTRYSVGGTITLTYNATQTATAYNNGTSATTYTGCWQMEDYNTNDNTIHQQRDNNGNITVNSSAGKLYQYMYCMTNKNGELIPFNNNNNATTTYTKTYNTAPFDPFGRILYYSSTTEVAAGSNAGATSLYDHYQADVRRAMNIQSDGTAGTTSLTAHKPIYLKVLYNKTTGTATFVQDTSSSSYLDRSGIVQALPTTNPNSGLTTNTYYLYIYLGKAYSLYQMELTLEHPVYYWDINAGAMINVDAVPNMILSGTTDPASSLGNNGDIYIKYSAS